MWVKGEAGVDDTMTYEKKIAYLSAVIDNKMLTGRQLKITRGNSPDADIACREIAFYLRRWLTGATIKEQELFQQFMPKANGNTL